MQKEYAYDKKYLGMQRLSLIGFPIYSLMLLRNWDFPTVPALLAIIAVTMLLWYDLRRRERTTFVLDNKGVVCKSGQREKRIQFDEISQVRFLMALPYQIRTSIESDESTFRVGRDLVNISDFLMNLKIALDTTGLSGRYNKKKFIRSLLLGKHRDRYQAAPAEVQKAAAKVVVCMFLNAAALASYLTQILHFKIGWWLAVAAVWPLMLSAFFHILSYRRFVSLSKPDLMIFPEYDIDAERSLFNKVLIIGELIFAVVALVVIQAL